MTARVVAPRERWVVLAAAFVVMAVAGTIFSWSLFTRPLVALFGWSSVQVALVFSLVIVFFAVGAIVGGFAHDRFGPRGVALAGAALWGIGSILAGLGLERLGLWWLYLTYGALGGIGCGMVYVVPGATITKWFPEERGLANGVILAGYGLGSLAFNLIVGSLGEFRRVADASNAIVETRNAATTGGHAFALAPSAAHADIAVIAGVFLWSGIVFLIVGGLATLFIHAPPPTFSIAKAAAKLALERDVKPGEMVRTRAFYLMWLVIFINATCGLALFSNAVPIYAKVAGLTAAAATVVFGGLSAANGIGRFLWAWLSDFIGRKASLSICFALQGVALLWIARGPGTGIAVAFTVMLLCFGGIFGIAPAVMADLFGTRFLGEDYSFIITAAAVAGVLGPLSAAWFEDQTGSVTAWLLPAAVVTLLAAIVPLLIGKTGRPLPSPLEKR
ncbi:MAG: OFA family MFS transporter [Candidatus Baltobacteraceae bacterium]